MAEQSVTVNDVLCFLRHKFVKTAVKQLKAVLMDFYSIEVLSRAKEVLLNDIASLRDVLKLPHMPRRTGDNRVAREVDDIVTIFTCLDEHKKLDNLPRYVADGPDNMPSVRLFEGDLNAIMVILRGLIAKVDEYGSGLSSLRREIQELYTSVPVLSACAPRPSNSSCLQQPRPSVSSATEFSNCAQEREKTTEQPSASTCNVPDWAAISSTPYAHANRYDALRSTDDDEHSDALDQARFIVPQSRRAKRRNRQQSSTNQGVQQPQQPQQQQRQPARSRAMLGKSINTVSKITAAKQIRKKAVFCIDNVNTNCSVDDMKSFVSGMSVTVLTCFEVKSRRRRSDNDDTSDRKAFRLCIFDDDRNRLLNESAWPDSVSVSDWFFKPKQNVQQEQDVNLQSDKRRKVSSGDQGLQLAVAAAAPAGQDLSSSDDTIVGHYMDCSDNAIINDGGRTE